MIWVMVLLYVLNGQVVFEKSTFQTEIECIETGSARAKEVMSHPNFDQGLLAQCIQLPGQAVQS